ncbi:MAG: 16S rRNA (guanine(966)-N(2))-methyltransferase RsmD [Woeseiaceae bacterium]
MAKRNAEKTSQPGRLRIVAGNWRSRLLEIADVPGLRPTSARIRETLFNWLAASLPGARCLDLFAGTGALGLEALSRGATHCTLVEKSAAAAAVLRNNIDSLQATGATVLEMDALKFLQQPGDGLYDVVFLDPPFAADLQPDLCRLLQDGSILADNARVYIEEDRSRPAFELPEQWQVLKTKNAGNVRYTLVDAGKNE